MNLMSMFGLGGLGGLFSGAKKERKPFDENSFDDGSMQAIINGGQGMDLASVAPMLGGLLGPEQEEMPLQAGPAPSIRGFETGAFSRGVKPFKARSRGLM
jgi:hypothetical protein